jgi:hypothetical protein
MVQVSKAGPKEVAVPSAQRYDGDYTTHSP